MAKKPPKSRIDASDSRTVNQGLSALAALKTAETPEAKTKAAEPEKPKNSRWNFGPKVVLQREVKGRGGKTVVRVRGLDLDKKKLVELSKYLKSSLGCGAQVDGEDLLLLGSVGERARDLLVKQGARKVVLGN